MRIRRSEAFQSNRFYSFLTIRPQSRRVNRTIKLQGNDNDVTLLVHLESILLIISTALDVVRNQIMNGQFEISRTFRVLQKEQNPV